MDQLIAEHPIKVAGIVAIATSGLLVALHRLGWLRIGKVKREWDGEERRECTDHPHLQNKVCGLHTKIEDLDKKVDRLSEKMQYLFGMLEHKLKRAQAEDDER